MLDLKIPGSIGSGLKQKIRLSDGFLGLAASHSKEGPLVDNTATWSRPRGSFGPFSFPITEVVCEVVCERVCEKVKIFIP